MTLPISSMLVNSPFVRSDHVFAARRDGAARHVEVGRGERLADSGNGQLQRFEPARIEVHLDLAHEPAVHLDAGDAVHLLQQRLHLVLDQQPRLVGGERGRHGIRRDRQCRDVEARDGRVLYFLRQPEPDGGHFFPHLGRRALRIEAELEFDADAREALTGVRLDALHALDAGHRVFDRLGDERLDFLGRRAGIDRGDVDEWKVDGWKQVDPEPRHRHDPQHHEAEDEHRGKDRTLDGGI